MLQQLTYEQSLHLLRLRTVIARAAQKDSLQWWEDESLTSQGAFLLERIFPGAPGQSGRNLALGAATMRHQAALQSLDNAIHLFRMSSANIDQLAMRALRGHFEEGVTNFTSPIPDFDALRQHLLAITGKPSHYERMGALSDQNGLRIRLAKPPTDFVDRANALAWAYLEGDVGQPVFPHLLEQR